MDAPPLSEEELNEIYNWVAKLLPNVGRYRASLAAQETHLSGFR
jgi:hypothetical protein